MLPFHRFYSLITRLQQQQQQQLFFALSPCFRYCLAPAIVRFRIHVFLSWILYIYFSTTTTTNVHRLIALLSLSSCFRLHATLEWILFTDYSTTTTTTTNFFALSPCFRYCPAPAIVRFRIHVAISLDNNNNFHRLITIVLLSLPASVTRVKLLLF